MIIKNKINYLHKCPSSTFVYKRRCERKGRGARRLRFHMQNGFTLASIFLFIRNIIIIIITTLCLVCVFLVAKGRGRENKRRRHERKRETVKETLCIPIPADIRFASPPTSNSQQHVQRGEKKKEAMSLGKRTLPSSFCYQLPCLPVSHQRCTKHSCWPHGTCQIRHPFLIYFPKPSSPFSRAHAF